MKTFTILFQNSQYPKSGSPIGSFYRYSDMHFTTTGDVNEARHYTSRGKANQYLKSLIKSLTKKQQEFTSLLDNSNGTYYHNHYKRNINTIKDTLLPNVQGATVIEIDIESPNFPSVLKKQIKFNDYYSKYGGFDSFPAPKTNNKVCRCCGIKMKGIPYIQLRSGNRSVICIICIEEMNGTAARLKKPMPPEWVKEVESERFLQRM